LPRDVPPAARRLDSRQHNNPNPEHTPEQRETTPLERRRLPFGGIAAIMPEWQDPSVKGIGQMTEKELKKILRGMRETAKEACKSQESARAFLVKAGIIT